MLLNKKYGNKQEKRNAKSMLNKEINKKLNSFNTCCEPCRVSYVPMIKNPSSYIP